MKEVGSFAVLLELPVLHDHCRDRPQTEVIFETNAIMGGGDARVP